MLSYISIQEKIRKNWREIWISKENWLSWGYISS